VYAARGVAEAPSPLGHLSTPVLDLQSGGRRRDRVATTSKMRPAARAPCYLRQFTIRHFPFAYPKGDMMNKSKVPLAPALLTTIIVSGTLFTGAARAADMRSVCNNFPCIYDAHNTIVGISYPYGKLERLIHGTWYSLDFSQAGLTHYLVTYYAANGCAGQPMAVQNDNIPRLGMYDGQSVWTAVGTPTSFSWSSYQYIVPTGGLSPTCVNACSPPCTTALAIAKKIERPVFYPPLHVK
jgi:hypothetical protein